MHVVILSDLETQGGAAIAASRLTEALIEQGVRVTRIVGIPDGERHPWDTLVLRLENLKFWERCGLKFSKGILSDLREVIKLRMISKRLESVLSDLQPDIINIHNLHYMGWSPDLIKICKRFAPVVWTLHDMWSFTGHCAYSYDCEKFITGCDKSCPIPFQYPPLQPKLIKNAWDTRQRLFREYKDIVAISPSHWLAKEAKRGLWKGHDVYVVPNGLLLNVYKPIDKEIARASLGIRKSGLILLSAAQNLNVHRKGGNILIEALKRISDRQYTFLTFGRGILPEKILDNPVLHLGFVNPERVKVLAYNAADLFVHPAPVDNFPNTVLESIACGTPIVSFNVGGLSEMVKVKQSGWLSDVISPAGLAEKIECATDEVLKEGDYRNSCRNIAESHFSSQLQAKRYLSIFKSLC